MKHFLPSSVMLTPFLVKYYDEEPQEASDSPEKKEHQVDCIALFSMFIKHHTGLNFINHSHP
ncbi:hypothetical protein [uncultured Vibrio sp.]|uniref:hypothetical protein n=1 Tax=uncultured Vibrio sp. TaxID=114054 RepID=UPI0026082B65|nr:hypothetical protein [uncultured Vibrio sp.]